MSNAKEYLFKIESKADLGRVYNLKMNHPRSCKQHCSTAISLWLFYFLVLKDHTAQMSFARRLGSPETRESEGLRVEQLKRSSLYPLDWASKQDGPYRVWEENSRLDQKYPAGLCIPWDPYEPLRMLLEELQDVVG